MRIRSLVILLALFGTSSARGVFAPSRQATVQFFGDTFIPEIALRKTPFISKAGLLHDVKPLLEESDWNVANFEGVVVGGNYHAFAQKKKHHLRMPPEVPSLLRAAGIQVVTLANNHIMDYGLPGLLDSLATLRQAGVYGVGAGRDQEEANRALTLPTPAGDICLIAVSKTLPENFWANGSKAGTAHKTNEVLERDVRECARTHDFTFVVFHWGTELSSRPRHYQRELAYRAINAGATAVLGHHPHVLQPIEIYKNKPIFYSLGNFAFGTLPRSQRQEGMAVRFILRSDHVAPTFVLTPLQVTTAKTHFIPRRLNDEDRDLTKPFIPRRYCHWIKEKRHWVCRLPGTSIVDS